MSNLPPTPPVPPTPPASGDDERIRAALHGYADTIETADAWPTIVEKLDERRSPFAWFAQHPLALGAMAAVLLLLVVVSVGAITGDDDEESQDLDYVGPDQVDEATLIAITADGGLVELDADGKELRVIVQLDDERDLDRAADLIVSRDGQDAILGDSYDGDCGGLVLADLRVPTPGVLEDSLGMVVVARLGLAPSLSADGNGLAYVTAEGADQAEDPCSLDRHLTVNSQIGAEITLDIGLPQIPIPSNVEITQTLWLDDDRVAVVGHGKDPTISSLSAAALSIWVVDPATDTELGTPLEIALPLGTRLAPTGTPGEVFVAGHVDSVPFDLNPAGTYVGNDNTITIWRGSLDTLDADLIGVVDNSTQLPGGAPSTAAPIPGPEQRVESLSATPGGDALVTISEFPENARTTGSPVLYRVTGEVDPAVDPETRVAKLAEGILAAAPRGTSEPAPSPVSDAGPVVGARPDGSVARLDAETGGTVEELAADDDFGGAAMAGNVEPEDVALLSELAVTADGQVIQTRPLATDSDCADDQFSADWDLYGFAVEDGTPARLLPGDNAPPSRMPAISPDGTHIAYVSTSNGERCDGALMVVVADRVATEQVATHAMPVGVDVTGLTWTDDEALIVQHVAGNDGEFPSIIPVTLHQPLTSGPVDFGASSVGYGAPAVLAASGDAEWPHLFGASNGGPLHVDLDDIYSDIAHEPPAAITLPWSKDQGSIRSVARDRADAVWITVGLGEPAWPTSTWESYATYRWALPTTGQASTLAMVSEEFLAVAASPPEAAEPVVETDAPDVIDPSATVPGVTAQPTETSVPDTTVPAATPTTTTPALPPMDDAEMLYLTWQGDLIRRTVGGEPQVVATVPTPADPIFGVVHPIAPQLAVSPDGTRAFVSTIEFGAGCKNATLYEVDLMTGAVTEAGAGQAPAVSPDGTKLAYWRTQDNLETCDAVLVVRDVANGDERQWKDTLAGEVTPANFDHTPAISRIEWGPDNRMMAFERMGEGGGVAFLFDTETPEGEALPTEDFIKELPPEGGWWTLIGFDREGVVARSECRGQCPDDVVVRTFPVDGSAPARADWTMSTLSNDTAYGPQGFLSLRDCVSEGEECLGYPLWYEPLDGLDEEVESQDLVVAATWFP